MHFSLRQCIVDVHYTRLANLYLSMPLTKTSIFRSNPDSFLNLNYFE